MRTDPKARRVFDQGSDQEGAATFSMMDDAFWTARLVRGDDGLHNFQTSFFQTAEAKNPSPTLSETLPSISLTIQTSSMPSLDAAPHALSYHALGFEDGKASSAITAPTGPSNQAILVQWAAGVSEAQWKLLIEASGASKATIVSAGDGERGDLVRVVVPAATQATCLEALQRDPHVRFAEPDWNVGVQAIANDTYYSNGSLWGVYGDKSAPTNAFGSQAAEAWSAGKTGSAKIVVGDIDTGIDYTHADLYLNVWLNQGELRKDVKLVDIDSDGLITFRDLNASQNASYVSDINRNGRIDAGDLLKDARWVNGSDNDGNGYIDDLIGWDFVNNDNDPYDDNNHGTHTAGTIGAMGGNGTGVAGVNWSVGIMALKFMNATGAGSLSSAIAALDYYSKIASLDKTPAEFIGTNNSWGGAGYSQALLDAITRAAKQDALFIAAAGNGGSDGIGDNNDIAANFPSNYSTVSSAGFESVIAVAALTSTGAMASFSNYGASTVDLAAPGAGIWSTVAGGGYASFSGTSMATPHVTGALALLASIHPEYSASQLRDALLSSTAATASLTGKTVTGGRLDISAIFGDTNAVTPAPAPTIGITLYGTAGNDALIGTSGNDVMYGIANASTNNNLGKNSVDTLTGGAGNDLFVLGDTRGVFYNDGVTTNAGYTDYAVIKDFSSGDKIQVKGGTYFLANLTLNGTTGVGLYWDSNANGKYEVKDEFIAHLQGVTSIATSQFTFV